MHNLYFVSQFTTKPTILYCALQITCFLVLCCRNMPTSTRCRVQWRSRCLFTHCQAETSPGTWAMPSAWPATGRSSSRTGAYLRTCCCRSRTTDASRAPGPWSLTRWQCRPERPTSTCRCLSGVILVWVKAPQGAFIYLCCISNVNAVFCLWLIFCCW